MTFRSWPFILDLNWTAQVFFTLHTLAFLMKMHSYAFYNGHLSETERRLSALDDPATASPAPAYRYPSAPDLSTPKSAYQEKKEQDDEQTIASLREDLAIELTSPQGRVTYPQNLTVGNYLDYIVCPTCCYELEYPRTESIEWMNLMKKVLAVFGCIFLLTIISEEFILPVLTDSRHRLQLVDSLPDIIVSFQYGLTHCGLPSPTDAAARAQ